MRYRAEVSIDENGHWTAVVRFDRHNSAISDSPSLDKLERRIRQAVATHLDCRVSEVEVDLDVRLSAQLRSVVQRHARAKAAHERAAGEVASVGRQAAEKLVRAGMSRRDAGHLLGVSGARVQQLLNE